MERRWKWVIAWWQVGVWGFDVRDWQGWQLVAVESEMECRDWGWVGNGE